MVKKISYKKASGGFTKAPIGTHPAIIVGVSELGTAMSEYGSNDRNQDLMQIHFEIEATVNCATKEELEKDKNAVKMADKIFTTIQDYNFVVNDRSKLGKMIAGVYGQSMKDIKDFVMTDLLGKKCVITVVHSDSGWASVDSVSVESTKMKYHEKKAELFYFGLTEEEYDEDLFQSFSKMTQERIEKSKEYKELKGYEEVAEVVTEKPVTEKVATEEVTSESVDELFGKKEEKKKETPVEEKKEEVKKPTETKVEATGEGDFE